MAFKAASLVRQTMAINARWPGRDRSSDGWIGDRFHTTGDHVPAEGGIVRATDTDVDGLHIPTVVASFILHPSTNYVISNRRIFSRIRNFMPVEYGGSNPHTGHIHDSILHTSAAANSTAPWELISTTPQWGLVRVGASGTSAKQVQAYLNGHGSNLVVDGDFGGKTDTAVRAFQRRWGLEVDGVVGPRTTAAFRTK
jgi:hypothetical protein